MQLGTFISDRDLTDEGFARLLGPDVSEWAVRKWRYGQRIPRLGMQQRIARATNGAVTPNDFVEAAVAADVRRVAAVAKRTGAAA